MSVKSYWYINYYKQIYANSPAYGGWKASGGDTFRIALCPPSPAYTPNQDTQAVLNDIVQVVGQGYIAGGQVLTGKTISVATGALVMEANPVSWAGCVFTARYAVIYDDSNTGALNKQLLRWIDFEQDIQLAGQTLTLTFNGAGSVVITPPADVTPPQLTDASIDGPTLTLSYSEQLDTTSVPTTGAYTVTVNGTAVTLSTVSVSSLQVSLTLATAVVSADVVLISYIAPLSGMVRDLAFNPAAGFTNTSVFNTTTPPPPPPPPPDVTPPVVTITSPLNGATISDTIAVDVTATDANGVVSVVLYVDGVSFSTDTSSPYSFGLDTKTLVNGAHTLVARAIDPSGNIGISSTINVTVSNVLPPPPDTTAPSVSITSPLPNAYLSGTFTIAVSATDNVGVVSATLFVDSVSQGVDPTQPYSFALNTTLFTDTIHTLVVTAIDAAGNVGTSVSVPVNIDNTAPVMTSPLVNGASLVLNYNETLNAASVPLASAFVVKTDGSTRTVNSVSISGVQVLITLAVAVIAANVVTVSYTAPTGTGATPIEDRAGNNAANLVNQAVSNVTPGDSTPPTISSLTVNGATLIVQYNENLDVTSVPATSAFACLVNGSARSIGSVTISGRNVTLTLV
jgi:large repetitive protein